MLIAEIHGKTLEAARDSEDYLTSAVFGHLRYIPPGPFWDNLFLRAKGLPGVDSQEPLLGYVLSTQGRLPSSYTRLKVHFWDNHPRHGEPDLIMIFTADGIAPMVVLIEVKLWSEKSGTGENDQLARYLRILEDLATIGIRVPAEAERFLIYLTPRESVVEVWDSADQAESADRLFRLQWQDVLEAAATTSATTEPTSTILTDVARFLRKLGLEYFDGMTRMRELPFLEQAFGAFYSAELTGFRGMTREPDLSFFEISKGVWA